MIMKSIMKIAKALGLTSLPQKMDQAILTQQGTGTKMAWVM
jgi:hypothetical protein